MPFCNKCGNKLDEGDVFCSVCGAKVSITAQSKGASGSSQSNDYPDPAPVMSKTESIALLEKLASKYGSLERTQKEIKDLEQAIEKTTTYQAKPYSAFRFFWPYMVYSAIAAAIFVVLAFVVFPLFSVFIAAAYIVPIVLTIVGAVRARRLRERYNNDLFNSETNRRRKKREDEERLSQLRSNEKSLKKQLEKYDEMVPVNMRNKSRLTMAKRMLEMDKVHSFEEAMKLKL